MGDADGHLLDGPGHQRSQLTGKQYGALRRQRGFDSPKPTTATNQREQNGSTNLRDLLSDRARRPVPDDAQDQGREVRHDLR